MEDAQIVDLYWARDERAIAETDRKYGAFCHAVAHNVLAVREDAEECVNDAYQKAWESIPPQRPLLLRAWLGKVVRNLALNLWNRNHALKRGGGADVLLSELEDCIPSPEGVVRALEDEELGRVISDWLRTLPRDDRALFVRRYWNGEALGDLAAAWHITPAKLAQRMYRLRRGLKAALEQEGIAI